MDKALSYGLQIVRLPENTEHELPAAWGLKDIVTGYYRGRVPVEEKAEQEMAGLASRDCWCREPRNAWRANSKRAAGKAMTEHIAKAKPDQLTEREVAYWRGLKPWSPWAAKTN